MQSRGLSAFVAHFALSVGRVARVCVCASVFTVYAPQPLPPTLTPPLINDTRVRMPDVTMYDCTLSDIQCAIMFLANITSVY